jgi:ABC-type amino acid transport substrate-binding protein
MRRFLGNHANRILHWFRRGGPVFVACAAFLWVVPGIAAETLIRCFPSGAIYEYRWKLLDLALAHTRESGESFRLIPYAEDTTQNRAVSLLQSGAIDVIALGTNEERESKILPVKIDILRGIVGFRVFLIRSADQERISQMDDVSLRKQLTLGLNSQWADLPIVRANGFSVTTSSGYQALFDMLAAGRFDAFPRGLNEAQRELDERRQQYPQFAVEKTRALYFPYPIYFWVRKDNQALAQRIERGLKLSLADGSFRKTFEQYHAAEIATMRREKRHVLRLASPILPHGTPQPDTSWWWHNGVVPP